jgi:predicted nucleotidyltransferase
LRRIRAELAAARAPCALVGGLAVSARTEPRFTRDADLAVAVESDREAEALVSALRASGYSIEALIEQDAKGRLAAVRLGAGAGSAPVVDLLFASSGIEPEIVHGAERLELLPGLTIGVARTGHLIALKLLSRDDTSRPQDLADLQSLLRVASADELNRARSAVGLITARGYDRGRALAAELESLIGRRAR